MGHPNSHLEIITTSRVTEHRLHDEWHLRSGPCCCRVARQTPVPAPGRLTPHILDGLPVLSRLMQACLEFNCRPNCRFHRFRRSAGATRPPTWYSYLSFDE